MATIYCVQNVDMQVLQRLATKDPEAWADAYEGERVRRHPDYQRWLKSRGLPDVHTALDHYRKGHR